MTHVCPHLPKMSSSAISSCFKVLLFFPSISWWWWGSRACSHTFDMWLLSGIRTWYCSDIYLGSLCQGYLWIHILSFQIYIIVRNIFLQYLIALYEPFLSMQLIKKVKQSIFWTSIWRATSLRTVLHALLHYGFCRKCAVIYYLCTCKDFQFILWVCHK